MKKLFLLFTFILSLQAKTEWNVAEWWVADKQEHFNYSAMIASTIFGIAKHNDADDFVASVVSIGSTIFVGWVKEQVDGFGNGTKEISDVDADTLGAITGTVTMIFVYKIEF